MKSQFVFKWDPEYLSIHVEAMDRDHEKLIDLMNQVHRLHLKNASRDQIQGALKRLGAFVVDHFQREEQYFATLKEYLDASIHKDIHKKLVSKYMKFVQSYEAGQNLNDDFFYFLKAWLVAHIEGVDSRYGKIAQKRAA